MIEGPVATMLDDAEIWVARNTASAIVERPDGDLYDEPQFPARAVREIVANALIHRDLSPYALNRYASLTLEPGSLTITSPGGLYGLTVDALGHTDSSLRNGLLASLLLSIRSPSGKRLIERLGSGIPAARDAMRRARLADPQFFDTGLNVTVRLRNRHSDTTAGRYATKPQRTDLTPTETTVVAVLAANPATATEISHQSGLTLRQVRHALKSLTMTGHVTTNGASRNVRYSLAERD